MSVTLSALAARIGGVAADGSEVPAIPITGVTLRAQDTVPGDLFAALPGAKAHGADYVAQAIAGGAVAVLTDDAGVRSLPVDCGVPVLVHAAPRSVLGVAAAQVYGNPSAEVRVIGVTGTSGKTTTTYLVEAGLRAAGRRAGLIGTVGIRIDGTDQPSALTTPEAPALQALLAVMVEHHVDTVVMEVSSHALALGRVDGVRFAVGGFTNLSRDHLDFHPSMQDYFDTKAKLFDPDSPMRVQTAAVCVDDEAGRAMAQRAGAAVVTVSATGSAASWRADDVRTLAGGAQRFVAVDPSGGRHELIIGLPGRYNVANCLLALALLSAVDVTPEQAAPGLQNARVPGRLESVECGQDFLALVDYAHKPGALRAVLETLREHGGRLGVVFGAGGDRDPGKRAAMGRVAAELADLVVVTDDNPRSEDPAAIRAAILAGAGEESGADGPDVMEIADRRQAIARAVGWARPGDVVLIAGKGHETGQTRAGVTTPFDDREELAAALIAIRSGA